AILMSNRVLLVDDDSGLCEMLEKYLGKFGFQVVSAGDTQEAFVKLSQFEFHLIILDIMLPGRNGFEICQEIRRESNLPILFLSARGEVSDRVVGLEFGADDFLPKPFEPRELVARIQT